MQETICGTPWTSVSQRGVAYRDDNDTFYLGGWNENVIYHVKGLSWDNPGEVLEQHFFSPGGRGLAGMAWNDDAKVLWVATNSPDDNIYALMPDEGWVQVAELGHPDPGFNGGGLSMDDEGNLWMVSQGGSTAYLIDSGIPAFSLGWLRPEPMKGTVAPGESVTIAVTIDALDLEPGTYEAVLAIQTDSGRPQELQVAITAEVLMGERASVEGIVGDANDGEPVAAVTVTAFRADGAAVASVTTGDDGSYRMELLLGEYTLEASAADYGTETAQVDLVEAGATEQVDFALPTARGEVNPEALEFTVPVGGQQQPGAHPEQHGQPRSALVAEEGPGVGWSIPPGCAPAEPGPRSQRPDGPGPVCERRAGGGTRRSR